MFLQTASGTEIALILGFLAIMILGVLFYGYFIEEPEQKKEKDDWISKNNHKLQYQSLVSTIIGGSCPL